MSENIIHEIGKRFIIVVKGWEEEIIYLLSASNNPSKRDEKKED